MKKIFKSDNAEHKTIKERLGSRQLHLKLIALGLAIILWLYVSAEDSVGSKINNKEDNVSEKTFTVEIMAEDLPSGLEIRSELPDVQFVLQGTAENLLQIESDDLQAKADLSGAVPGLNEIELETSVPDNVELISSSAQTVIVEIGSVNDEEEMTQTEESSETPEDTSADAAADDTTDDTSAQTGDSGTTDQTDSQSTQTDSSQSTDQSSGADENTEQSSPSGTEENAADGSASGN